MVPPAEFVVLLTRRYAAMNRPLARPLARRWPCPLVCPRPCCSALPRSAQWSRWHKFPLDRRIRPRGLTRMASCVTS
eukprot:2766139-Prymnesium_polylepis.1